MVVNYKNFQINILELNEDGTIKYEVLFGDAPVIEEQDSTAKVNLSAPLSAIKAAIDGIIATLPPALNYQPNNYEDDDN